MDEILINRINRNAWADVSGANFSTRVSLLQNRDFVVSFVSPAAFLYIGPEEFLSRCAEPVPCVVIR